MNFLLPSYYQTAADGADVNGGLALLDDPHSGEEPNSFPFHLLLHITRAKLEVIRPTEVSREVYMSVGSEKLRTLSQLTCPGLPEQTQYEHLDLHNRPAPHAHEHTKNAALEEHSVPRRRAPDSPKQGQLPNSP